MKPKIAIVGAGLAGLACAHHLTRRGYPVTVLEARDRVGGRVFTVRDWSKPLVAEAGAEFIDSHHRRVQAYARHFGLSLRKLNLWEQLPPEPAGVDRFWSSLRALSEQVRSRKKPWPFSPELEALDQVSVEEWCRRLGLDAYSHKEIETWCWGVESASPKEVSILGLIVEESQRPERAEQEAFTLTKGMGSLADCFLESVHSQGGEVVLGAPVRAVERSPRGVVLLTEEQRFECERAVLTLPAPLLGELRFFPELSEEKRKALKASNYGALVKTLLEFEPRFWDTEGPFVRVKEGELNSIWECTQATEGGVLVLWSTLKYTPELASLSEAERIRWSLEALEKILPGCGECFVKGRSFDWSASPFSAGGYSYFQLGYLTQHAQRLPEREHLLHFAGEHTSPFCGYMEGALESGHRAALEILKGK